MKLLIRLTILALAAVGARTLFERLRPRVSGATGARSVVGETLTPAFREAASSVRNASKHAAHEVADATRQAAQELKDGGSAPGTRPTGSPAPSDLERQGEGAFGEPGPRTHDHPLSAMAAGDLGLDEPS
jgi:hypothetical protein